MLKKVTTALAIWAAFLTRHDRLNKDHLPKRLDTNSLKQALHVLDTMHFTNEERMADENHLKWLRIEANTRAQVRRGRRREGKIEGIQIGQEKGKLAIAKAMLQKGYPIADIMLLAGLSQAHMQDVMRPLQ